MKQFSSDKTVPTISDIIIHIQLPIGSCQPQRNRMVIIPVQSTEKVTREAVQIGVKAGKRMRSKN